MCLEITTLGDENIARVLADPPLIWTVLAPDDQERYEAERAKPRGFLARLFGRKPEATTMPEPLRFADGEIEIVDLDKSWHGIHFMLTQTLWEGPFPLCFLVRGGTEVGDIDAGYGPARAFVSKQVREIDAALAEIDEAFLRNRFDPATMTKLGIYPPIWDRDPADDDTFGYCAEFFAELKTFVGDAAARGIGIVVSLC